MSKAENDALRNFEAALENLKEVERAIAYESNGSMLDSYHENRALDRLSVTYLTLKYCSEV